MHNYQECIGKEFEFGTEDCLTLIRRFYKIQFNIDIPNYARPKNFWQHDLDLYGRLTHKEGFTPLTVHPSEYQFGDLVLMAIQSSFASHAGVLVENGQLLHHLWGQTSCVTSYKGMFRNNTLAVMRHKDVKLSNSETPTDLMDVLSPGQQRRIRNELDRISQIQVSE